MLRSQTIPLILTILLLTSQSTLTMNQIYRKDIDKNPDGILLTTEQNKEIIDSITPTDDAYHGSTTHPSMEWWYFDSIFTNGYSAHIGFKITSVQQISFLTAIVTIYKENEIIANVSKTMLPNEFKTSLENPYLEILGTPVMELNIQHWESQGQMKYHIEYDIDNVGVDLIFTGTTTGWKYITKHEGWTVALPKATVQGSISYNDKIIDVMGRGYHDHNWNFSLSTPVRAWGWYWGKITTEHYSFTWANIMETGLTEPSFVENLGVLNSDDTGFVQISSDNISFTTMDYEFIDGRFIPQKFHIYAKQGSTEINITMVSRSIHRGAPDLLTLHYWRYFVVIQGYITNDGMRNDLKDQIQIIEHMRFI